jgi:hypothetical protein
MRCQLYKNDNTVQEVVCSWFGDAGTDFCHNRIFKQKCMNCSVDLVEK